MCVIGAFVEVREQLQISSTVSVPGLNLVCQACWPAPLPAGLMFYFSPRSHCSSGVYVSV